MIEASVDVDVPLSMAYNQWTQFEEFPRFMDGVQEVRQLDDTTLHWTVELAGATRQFVTDIVAQEPDKHVVWKSREGQGHSGTVRFEPLDDGGTRVTIEMDYETQTWTESLARALNLVDMRVKDDLRRFKDFIEHRSTESGAWRGEIHDGQPQPAPDTEA